MTIMTDGMKVFECIFECSDHIKRRSVNIPVYFVSKQVTKLHRRFIALCMSPPASAAARYW
jgi:hypothetical protein